MTVEAALEIYVDDPNVEYAEPNYYRYTCAIPDDTYFGRLWGLHNTGQFVYDTSGTPDADIDAPEAWDITTGNSDIVIAVIDSGVDYGHPDLAGTYLAAPSGMSASAASMSEINLAWSDNSSNESGYKIERKTGAGGAYSQVAIIDANVSSYSDTGLSEATTYYYRVRAYNSDGDSDYSNEAEAKTKSGGSGGGGSCFISTAVSGSVW